MSYEEQKLQGEINILKYENERLHKVLDDVIIRLCAKNERLRAAFRVNMLRAFPHMSHEEIDAEINRVENEE